MKKGKKEKKAGRTKGSREGRKDKTNLRVKEARKK